MKIFTWLVLFFAGLVVSAQAQQSIIVDFSTGQLWHFYSESQRDVYPVVLPRTEVQHTMDFPGTVLGQLRQMDYQPTWWPTANMRRQDPSLPSRIEYGEPRHPIGLYRLRIAWKNPNNPIFWEPVRIHGGAQTTDLYRPRSAGCVRMLDADIEQLVLNINRAKAGGETGVQIAFGFFAK